ncbi:hypothetical protein GMPD_11300 [Geomonas paludis]|uniref:Uncharacterized protein n=1 Tax=Geomonas paludis TaxID=2740185 RepID=A0A6V8MTA6_9BACT|nr:hypothetical protein GMPD_11300 [Geomonas paludis]
MVGADDHYSRIGAIGEGIFTHSAPPTKYQASARLFLIPNRIRATLTRLAAAWPLSRAGMMISHLRTL